MYLLWDMEEVKKVLISGSREARAIGEKMYELIEEANKRHNEKMLKKDIEIAKLEGYIEGIENE